MMSRGLREKRGIFHYRSGLDDQSKIAFAGRNVLADLGAHAGQHLETHIRPAVTQCRQSRWEYIGAQGFHRRYDQCSADIRGNSRHLR